MASYIEVDKTVANTVKRDLIKDNYFQHGYPILKDTETGKIKFPVNCNYLGQYPIIKIEVPEDAVKTPTMSLKTFLENEGSETLIRSYDVVGNIAILDIPPDLESKTKEIADFVIQSNPKVQTVLQRTDKHNGVFRTQTMRHISGINTKIAKFQEHGCQFQLDVEQVYFSTRSSTERMRIAQLVKPDSNVLVMFSGAAPFPIIIGKYSKAKHIVGIELNPNGHLYGLKNVNTNRLEDRITLYNDDVTIRIPKLQEKFHFIVMPLPKTSLDFLELAISCAASSATVFLYTFGTEDHIKNTPIPIEKAFSNQKRNYKINRVSKNGQASPGIWRLVFDIEVI